ncbi:MAG: UDP-glucose 4-epimerase GalE [Ignavibacteriaceae bacterium]|jgi:UDP-glucose 4-epimerase
MAVLVTGGAGYIGSHVVRLLINKEIEVIVLDNLSRGHKASLPQNVIFEEVDLLDREKLSAVIQKHNIDSVIHFAAFAYVGESVENPEMYYRNNVSGSFNLINALKEKGVRHFVFSSTCSLYGNPLHIPISEEETTKPINPYAKTKLMIEQILADYDSAYGMKHVALRYFNAAGASVGGEIGESHFPEPHLIPLVLFTALDKRESISVYGDDYPTPDGTCIRDYIHVEDLAEAHVKALEYLNKGNSSQIINLGTGDGNSVKEVISVAEEVTGRKIKSVIAPRREGDPAVLVADNKKAKEILGWNPEFKLKDILQTAWQWHQNPKY